MGRIQDGGVRLDVAVQQLLVESVDPVTRTDLRSLQIHLSGSGVSKEELDPQSVIGVVLDAIMPRISNPGVLRLDRRQKVLERLEARVAAGGVNDPVLAGSLVTLRHELQNLSLLLRHRDRLIEG